jgi:hypothetical protein
MWGRDKGATTMRRFASWSPALALLLIVRPAFGLDGVRVTGTAAKLQLELNDNTVDQALTELRSAFGLKCRCTISLDRRVTGLYQGNINRVLSRLLEGYNFVVKTTSSGDLELIVFDASAPASLAQGVPPPIPGYAPAATATTDPVVVGMERALRLLGQKK